MGDVQLAKAVAEVAKEVRALRHLLTAVAVIVFCSLVLGPGLYWVFR